jgi:hypothetical protein
MSDTEVTVTQSESKQWWKLEYKGRHEFTDENPSNEEKREFRKNVDARIRQSAADARLMAKASEGGSTVREEPVRG